MVLWHSPRAGISDTVCPSIFDVIKRTFRWGFHSLVKRTTCGISPNNGQRQLIPYTWVSHPRGVTGQDDWTSDRVQWTVSVPPGPDPCRPLVGSRSMFRSQRHRWHVLGGRQASCTPILPEPLIRLLPLANTPSPVTGASSRIRRRASIWGECDGGCNKRILH